MIDLKLSLTASAPPAMRFADGACTVDQVEAAGGYSIIYADPPWSYSDTNCNGGIGRQYKTLTPEEIAAIPVARLAARDALLFLWGTYPKLPEVLDLISAWGFEYKSIAFQWVKTRGRHEDGSDKAFLGLGRWTRGNTEPCLLGVRGKPTCAGKDVSQLIFTHEDEDELLVSPVTRHSAKPPETRPKIVRLAGDLPRLELFAREKDVAGKWDAWGNEVESDVRMVAGTAYAGTAL